MRSIREFIWELQQKVKHPYYLALLRVMASIWFLKEIIFRLQSFNVIFGHPDYFKLDSSLTLERYGINVGFLQQHYQVVLMLVIVLLVMNIFGIGRNITSFFLFIAVLVLFHMNNKYANGGHLMFMLLLLYLSFANTFSYFTLFKRKPLSAEKEKVYNLITNLAAYSIIINLCLCYFLAGAFKAADPYYRHGWGIYYAANDDRFSVFATGGKHVNMPYVLSWVIGWGTIILELSFPFLVFTKKPRNIVLLLCLIMHTGAFFLLAIYDMSLVFVMQYGMLFSNEEVMGAAEKIRTYFRKLFRFA